MTLSALLSVQCVTRLNSDTVSAGKCPMCHEANIDTVSTVTCPMCHEACVSDSRALRIAAVNK